MTDDTPPGPYHTCPHPYHAGYSETNLPNLLFVLEKSLANNPPGGLLIENGVPALDWGGRPIRQFPHLPRYISTHPPGWLLEYWFRTNKFMTYRDIKARMTVAAGRLSSERSLDRRRELEARGPLALSDLRWKRIPITRLEVMRAELWSLDQIQFNTSMAIEYDDWNQPLHLRKKAIGPNGMATTEGQPTLPLRMFLRPGQRVYAPQQRLRKIFETTNSVVDRAKRYGYTSWQIMPANLLPSTWDENNSVEPFTLDWYTELTQDQREY